MKRGLCPIVIGHWRSEFSLEGNNSLDGYGPLTVYIRFRKYPGNKPSTFPTHLSSLPCFANT